MLSRRWKLTELGTRSQPDWGTSRKSPKSGNLSSPSVAEPCFEGKPHPHCSHLASRLHLKAAGGTHTSVLVYLCSLPVPPSPAPVCLAAPTRSWRQETIGGLVGRLELQAPRRKADASEPWKSVRSGRTVPAAENVSVPSPL